jgi:hypothetical protein
MGLGFLLSPAGAMLMGWFAASAIALGQLSATCRGARRTLGLLGAAWMLLSFACACWLPRFWGGPRAPFLAGFFVGVGMMFFCWMGLFAWLTVRVRLASRSWSRRQRRSRGGWPSLETLDRCGSKVFEVTTWVWLAGGLGDLVCNGVQARPIFFWTDRLPLAGALAVLPAVSLRVVRWRLPQNFQAPWWVVGLGSAALFTALLS